MPIYEYHCPQCGSTFEQLIRGNESPACPDCAATKVEKLFSVPAAARSSSGGLEICETPTPGNCGRPQCGMGGCQGF